MCNHCSSDPLSVLAEALRDCWSEATASPAFRDRWSEKNPALGQCSVTALVTQDLLGGEIMAAEVPNFGRHLWNRLENGSEIDFTRSQFPPGIEVPPGTVVSREAILNDDAARQSDLAKRYRLLRILLSGSRLA